ncbi:hypothetical protein CUZ56_00580 [Saezia sanguinis]|uniref:Bro-N domain-containing protein n=1 Tax=Saezia sanguinis TaxID=1965230 RepID=A0A433SH74_9BURK|nr:BRO family protein [Saezia sanguinis]RUS68095.1 hypothetical protein CUZ56_00580 [Saezia sanguinis]
MGERMENIIPFDFESNAVRVVIQDNNPWFAATDIAKVLDYRDASNLVRILDDDEKGTHKVSTPSLNQHGEYGPVIQELLTINESGLYSAIFNSRKPEAKRFKKWVTSEVLPAIRKTGAYIGPKASEKVQLSYRLMGLQQHSWKLIKTLKAETNKEIRQYLYNQLKGISQEIDIEPPALEEIGSDAPDVPEAVVQFWAVYDALQALGVKVNHSPNPDFIAISLKGFVREAAHHQIKAPNYSDLRSTLRQSKSPRFVDHKPVTSRIENKSVSCYVFERPAL